MKKKHFASTYVSITAILLSCLGAISVGFASWIISQGNEASSTGTINADTIDTKINGVTVSTTSSLNYGHFFFDEGNNYSERSSSSISYTIHYDGNQIIGDNSVNYSLSLSVSLSFGDGSLPIFAKTTYVTSITYGSMGNEANIIDDANFPDNKAITFAINEIITSKTYTADKVLTFTFSNRIIAKYGDRMKNGKFYLRLEAM